MLLSVLAVIFLILLGAVIAATETALVALPRHRLATIAEESPGLKRAIHIWLEEPGKYLTTIAVAVNLVAVVTSATVSSTVSGLAGFTGTLKTLVVVLSTLGVGITLIVFAEIIPKNIAIHNPEKVTRVFIKSLNFLNRLLSPFTTGLVAFSNATTKILGGKPLARGPFVTEEELQHLLVAGEEDGVLEEEERAMISSIFELGDTVVREVMVPRPDILCLEVDSTMEQALEAIVRGGFSRIPVYEDNLDNVVGILYAKDLLKIIGRGEKAEVKNLVRVPLFVPENKKVDELLREMRKRKIHMAIAVDEYGSTSGLVTIEDIVEEIVGEIFDEYDLEQVLVEAIDSNTFRVDARMPKDDVAEMLNHDFEGGEADTIGGFVYALMGHIPVSGETIDYDGLSFTVEKVHRRRISKIIIRRHEVEVSEA